MTDLEKRVDELRTQIAEVGDRVRVDAVAVEFLAGEQVFRAGDHFLYGSQPATVWDIKPGDAIGKNYERWGINCDGRSWEGARPFDAVERLYTRDEVAEIVAKAVMQALTTERS